MLTETIASGHGSRPNSELVLDRCHDLAVHHDARTGVVVLARAPTAHGVDGGGLSGLSGGVDRTGSAICFSTAGSCSR